MKLNHLSKILNQLRKSKERGNLALEQILFITAVVLLSAGVAVFYDNLSSYFQTFSVTRAPSQLNEKLLLDPTTTEDPLNG
ncbi:MAG: hypothetical protein LBE20_07550 [Deltaproteobacteria bacterium]|jgi:hypothetical protein|nr:hypothetical protein [Deltaproteobacteria bacterium]